MLLWDAYGLQSTHSGIGRHALDLAQNLVSLGEVPTIIPSLPRLDSAFSPWISPIAPFPAGRIKPLSLWASGHKAKKLGKEKEKEGGENHRVIYHGLSNYNIPSLPKSFRKVLTVHDLIPFLAPDAVSKALRAYLHFQTPRALNESDRIICVSKWTAQCLAEYHPQASSKITVIPNGRPDRFHPENKSAFAAKKIRLFSLSRAESYKRLELIPSILDQLPPQFEWHVLTQGQGLETLKNASPRLHMHTDLSDHDLETLWGTIDIFVHTSLWEGYCLPAVSALSRGIPSVYTGGSGIDEVVATAGVRMQANDTADAWAAAIEGAVSSGDVWRELCREQWGRLPSWREVASQTLGLYATLKA